MTRLIDADALKELEPHYSEDGYRVFYEYEIDNAPTFAVNCKDCDGYEAGYSAGTKDAERPQGEWVRMAFDNTIVYCSECHSSFDFPFSFCPICGADMRGEKNDV